MRIMQLETIISVRESRVHAGHPAWMWVRVHTDKGVVGLGETYPSGHSEAAVIHEHLSHILLGRDPLEIERLWQDMFLAVSYHGWAGAEMRAISAVDIALWDILGQVSRQPIYQLLGGKCRDAIPIYNTCYDHVYDFNIEADKLAKDLWKTGIRAMKIWPFDGIALKTRGQYISPGDMEKGLEPVKKVRDACGEEMEIAMEFHGYWSLPCAIKIAQALEPHKPMWLEEMLPQDNLQSYAVLAQHTRLPLTISERLMTRWQFREVVESRAARIIMPDIVWCGGISEARRIAALAETYYLPVAPHNCGGPVLYRASQHLAAAIPNLMILETVRRYYQVEYPELVEGLDVPENGLLRIPQGLGLGLRLREEVVSSGRVVQRVTEN